MNHIKNYQPPIDLLANKVILVTGAGQGIGKTAALSFADHGATVILHGRNLRKLEAVYDEIIAKNKPEPIIFPLDLAIANTENYTALADAIQLKLGRLDGILHNAASFNSLSPLENQSLEQWLTLLRVNLAAPFALTRACLPLLKAAPEASVVMTSETHGHQPSAYWGGFAVSKAGLEALVKIWSEEWDSFPNLRINAVIPGPIQSPQRAKTHPAEAKESLPRPENLMPAYLYLMGNGSQGTSGTVLDLANLF